MSVQAHISREENPAGCKASFTFLLLSSHLFNSCLFNSRLINSCLINSCLFNSSLFCCFIHSLICRLLFLVFLLPFVKIFLYPTEFFMEQVVDRLPIQHFYVVQLHLEILEFCVIVSQKGSHTFFFTILTT